MEIANSHERSEKRNSTKTYASKVFQESSVGLVSSLAHTSSTPRRIFKVIALILCLTGFLYQSGKFLSVVFQYPTTVGINILRPDVLDVPAFTFCNNNGINRRLFCEKFPNQCEKPSTEFCQKYEGYCGENETLVPKKESYERNDSMTLEDMINLNPDVQDFVTINQGPRTQENITGPYLRLRESYDSKLLCYSLYDRVNNSLDPLKSKRNKIVRLPVNKITFYVREDEMFLPGDQPGVLFAIHNPFKAVNPFEIGIFMRPGRTYMIFVDIQEEVLLKEPYDTNCVNYTEIWEKNGRSGPRMQESCRQKCLADIAKQCLGCVPPEFLFVTTEKYCTAEDLKKECVDDSDKLLYQCPLKCRDDCKLTKFTYTIQERFRARFNKFGDEYEDLKDTIGVEIFLEEEEIVVLKHSPKYMIVEVFSSIGGFIGCWLGINLLDIADIFEGFFRIVRYFFKRR